MVDDAISYYLTLAKEGDFDSAFHSLRELDPEALPSLLAACRSEPDPVIRSLLVESIWERRDPTVIDFLSEMLRDESPAVWKAALDGLVALGTHRSFHVLQAALLEQEPVRRSWIEEAMEQVAETIAGARPADS